MPAALSAAIQQFLGDAELVRYGIQAFMYLYVALTSALPPALPSSVALVALAVLRKHNAVAAVCMPCMTVLMQLFKDEANAGTIRTLLDAGVLLVIVHTLCQHAQGGAVREMAALTLAMLLANDALGQRRVVACDLQKLLREILGSACRPRGKELSVFESLNAMLVACAQAHGEACAEPGCELCGMQPGRCGAAGCSLHADAGANITLKRCASCRSAAYCCAAHQRDAWATHKLVCRARAAVHAAHSALVKAG